MSEQNPNPATTPNQNNFNEIKAQPIDDQADKVSLTRDMSGAGTVPGNTEFRVKGAIIVSDGLNDRVLIGKKPSG